MLPASNIETEDERRVCEIYREVLCVDCVDRTSTLLELGGDSLAAIRISTRLADGGAGVDDADADLIGTIIAASVADVAASVAALRARARPPALAATTTALHDIPLLPDQAWFLEEAVAVLNAPTSWSQARYFLVPPDVKSEAVLRAVSALWRRHDALRARFKLVDGSWRQHLVPEHADVPHEEVAIDPECADRLDERLAATAARLRETLDVEQGPLARTALIDCGPQQPRRLLLTAHHLVCDNLSFELLTDELEAAVAGGVDDVPTPIALADAAAAVDKLARSATADQELDYWLEQPWETFGRLPVDGPGPSQNVAASIRTVDTLLDRRRSSALLHLLPRELRVRTLDVVLHAIGTSLTQWTGRDVAVKVVHNGRTLPVERVSLSRTVGRFATSGVVFLPRAGDGGARGELHRTVAALRAVPNSGVGYSLLRWIGRPREISEQIESARWRADVLVNYLAAPETARRVLRPSEDPVGPRHHPSDPRFTPLEILVYVDGDRLALRWIYSGNLHRRRTMERAARTSLAVLGAVADGTHAAAG